MVAESHGWVIAGKVHENDLDAPGRFLGEQRTETRLNALPSVSDDDDRGNVWIAHPISTHPASLGGGVRATA